MYEDLVVRYSDVNTFRVDEFNERLAVFFAELVKDEVIGWNGTQTIYRANA